MPRPPPKRTGGFGRTKEVNGSPNPKPAIMSPSASPPANPARVVRDPLAPSFPHQHGTSRKSHEFLCRKCGSPLFHTADHLAEPPTAPAAGAELYQQPELGPDGTMYRFENPSGHTHDVALFTSASGVKFTSDPTRGASYFPPYQWRVVTCGSCGAHVGWRFEVAKVPPSPSPTPTPSASPSAAAKQRVARTYSESTERAIMASLERKCLTVPDGWWTYEWCHRKSMRQYHRDPDGTVSTDWSLGEFDELGRVTAATRPALAGYYTTHFFINGQPCDELDGKGRRTEVHFFCCASGRPAPYVESFEELSVCKYRFVICVPELCMHSTPRAAGASRSDAASAPHAAAPSAGLPTTPFFAALYSAVIGEAALAALLPGSDYVTGLNTPYFYFA